MRAHVPFASTAPVTPCIDAITTGVAFARLDFLVFCPGAVIVTVLQQGGIDFCRVLVILHKEGNIDICLLRHGRTRSASHRYIQLWLEWRK